MVASPFLLGDMVGKDIFIYIYICVIVFIYKRETQQSYQMTSYP
jgi:cbb3-type cytochrome oxidase subunit 3